MERIIFIVVITAPTDNTQERGAFGEAATPDRPMVCHAGALLIA